MHDTFTGCRVLIWMNKIPVSHERQKTDSYVTMHQTNIQRKVKNIFFSKINLTRTLTCTASCEQRQMQTDITWTLAVTMLAWWNSRDKGQWMNWSDLRMTIQYLVIPINESLFARNFSIFYSNCRLSIFPMVCFIWCFFIKKHK